ncbi:AAA family ATPase [Actinomadura atramentaria]|uniref:AAA family ATPase n=1 Tax=Actinomadura atramentaria TaxID=1990 RepID=UPI000373FDA9|nr:AAA family ATPase [Actinomadura atramentaria]
MTVRVLLGTGDHELAVRLRAQVAELADVEVVGVESGSAELLAVAASPQDLDVVLVDELIGPQPAHDLARDLGLRAPHVASVLLSPRVDEESLARALEAGARGVMPRRPSLDELTARLTGAAEWSRGMRRWLAAGPRAEAGARGRVVALAGAKGGTGTTTLAVQLALAAARRRTVCLVDMDLQCGDVPSYLDLTHRRSIVDLVGVADALTGQLLADALYVHAGGPHVLLAPAEGEQAEDVTSLAARRVLGVLRSRYDVVLVDCGTFMTEGSVTAVELADTVALTVTPDLPCLRAAKRMTRLWARLQVRKPEDVVPVLTRLDRRSEIQPDFAARVLGAAPAKATVPPAFRALERAINDDAVARVDDEGYRRAVARLGVELGVLPEDAP